MLAQVPDLYDFVAGMKILLKPGGVITLEFPHLLSSWTKTSSIQSTTSISLIFRSSLRRRFFDVMAWLFDVEELASHGGSLRIYACHAEDQIKPVTPCCELLAREQEAGLNRIERYAHSKRV